MSLPESAIPALYEAERQRKITTAIIVLIVILLIIIILATIVYFSIYAREQNIDINPFDNPPSTVIESTAS